MRLFVNLHGSNSYLIYINPRHKMSNGRTLIISQMIGALTGYGSYTLLGKNYLGVGAAMIVTIVLMIVLNAVHPPAVSTALLFGLSGKYAIDLALFATALLLLLLLVLVQRHTLGLMGRFVEERDRKKGRKSSSIKNS